MADYICRDAAIEKITALINESGKYTAYESGADDACYIVEHEIPAADVRPVVRARWEDETGYIFSALAQRVYCPVCKSYAYFTPITVKNFCPNCGADMRGDHGNKNQT